MLEWAPSVVCSLSFQWLPLPYDHALRLTVLFTSLGILPFVNLSLSFVESFRWLAVLYGGICALFLVLLLYPNYATLKRMDALHDRYGEFLNGIPRPGLFADQFNNIFSWQVCYNVVFRVLSDPSPDVITAIRLLEPWIFHL